MEFVESALLADMIFEWHETPFCKLFETLHAPQEHSTVMDAMLVDMDIPEITISTPAPSSPAAKPAGDLPVCPSTESAPPVAVTEALAKLPLDVHRGAAFEEEIPPSAPFTPRAVKQTRRASKRELRSEDVKAPAKSSKRVGAEQVKQSRAPTRAEHIIRERQRRDDMAAKYLVLESLLPPASKVIHRHSCFRAHHVQSCVILFPNSCRYPSQESAVTWWCMSRPTCFLT